MEIIITSFYGTIIIPKNEIVVIYTTEERYYDKDENPVDKGRPETVFLFCFRSCQKFFCDSYF